MGGAGTRTVGTGSGEDTLLPADPVAIFPPMPAPGYQRFLAELKRRKVFRVVAVYGAAAFVVLQAADLLQEGLQLPQAFLTAVTVLGLAGFPLAVVLAWAYERTPHGVRRTQDAAPGEIDGIVSEPVTRRWPVGIAAAAGTALLLVSSWWMLGRPSAPGPGQHGEYTSVAVLPFENLGGGEEDSYFADGLTEELLNALTRVPGLRVAGRTSSFALRDAQLDIRTIGDTLGVETVLEGSVRRAGGRVRVTAQLVDAADGFHLWSRDWDRELTADNVFEIQDEIASAVATAMARGEQPDRVGAGPGEGIREVALVPASVRTSDLAAYELYLAGRHRWATRTPPGLYEAVELFEASLERDSAYAPAWVGLSAVYNALPWYTGYPAAEGAARSKAAARRALELDPGNAEALYTLATTVFEYDRAWEDAAVLFRRAIELESDYSQGLSWYCLFLAGVGRWREAVPWCERAVELDPLSLNGLVSLSEVLLLVQDHEEGLRASSRALAVQPDFAYPLMLMTVGLAASGRLGEAEEYLRRFARETGVPGGEAAASMIVDGVREPSRRPAAVEALLAWEDHEEMQAFMIVDWLALLGARAEALDVVDRLVQSAPPDLSSLNAMVATRILRGEPRFDAAVRALGIPDPPPEAEPVPW